MHGMRLLCAASLVSVRNRVCCVHNRARIVHGSSVWRFVSVSRAKKRIVCFVLALIHGLACCSHFLLVGLFWSFSVTIQKGYYYYI